MVIIFLWPEKHEEAREDCIKLSCEVVVVVVLVCFLFGGGEKGF